VPEATDDKPHSVHGNAAVLVLCDSRLSEFGQLPETIFSALGHFGVPYRVCDLAKRGVTAADLDDCAGVVIGQDNLGFNLNDAHQKLLLSAVGKGMGLVSFDYNLGRYGKPYLDALGVAGTRHDGGVAVAAADAVTVASNGHYLTANQQPGRHYGLRNPIPLAVVETGARTEIVAETDDGAPACIATTHGKGRIVQWLISPRLWTLQVFGHAHGLDDLFWKAIIWAARKPFVMHCIPPFVRFRFDDCYGHYRGTDDMAFVELLNEYGHKPNMCVCMHALKPSGWRLLKTLYDQGRVEVAPHTWKPGISLFFGVDGKQYSKARFKRMIAETADMMAENGIVPSKILSDHEHEYSARVLPYLKQLGIEYKMNVMLPGETWAGRHRDWAPKPYGSMSYALDYTPGPYPLFVVFNHYPAFDHARSYLDHDTFLLNRDGGYDPHMWDFLNGLTTRDRPENDTDAMAVRLAEHTRLGLGSLFFGGSISHSHFTRSMDLADWRAVIERYERLTSDLEKINTGYDDIAEYARSKFHTRITSAGRERGGAIKFRLNGAAKVPLKLSVFTEQNGRILRRYVDMPPFDAGAEATS
jgi:hypothetical protein